MGTDLDSVLDTDMAGSKKSSGLFGIVAAHKPSGEGSTALVSRLRRELGEKRIGHTGTLDRFASGLMLLVVGKATVFADRFLKQDKSYLASFRLGEFTDTHDPEGEVLRSRTPAETRQFMEEHKSRILDTITAFQAETIQTPPLYSALKKQGKRYSDLARGGITDLPAPRSIKVHELEIRDFLPEEGLVRVYISVSSGTYIRSFARDLSEKLDFPGHLGALERLSVGEFRLDQPGVWIPEDPQHPPRVQDIRQALPDWPRIELEPHNIPGIQNGIRVPFRHNLADGVDFFICEPGGRLLAWARSEKDSYRYKRVFSD